MLFPLSPATEQCEVFKVLNDEFLYFLEQSVTATVFSEILFRAYLHEGEDVRSACWTNEATREKFERLWDELPRPQVERQELFDVVSAAQDVAALVGDCDQLMAQLSPNALFEAVKALTVHLFTRSKDLSGIKNQASSSIEQHYQAFIRTNNSDLCFLCGTGRLSQNRVGLEVDKQWRADYDHILCKDKYPLYSAHPGNFIPTCQICNSKAKGARDLLSGRGGVRRVAFYPLPPNTESVYQFTEAKIHLRDRVELLSGNWDDPVGSAEISFQAPSLEFEEKVSVWKEVYQVPERVSAHIELNFIDRIYSDLRPMGYDDFIAQLDRFVRVPPADEKKSEWRFWWQALYQNIRGQDDTFLQDVWFIVEWRKGQARDEDMEATFT